MLFSPRICDEDILSRADKVYFTQKISLNDRNLEKTRHSVKSNQSARLSKILIHDARHRAGLSRPYSL